MPQGSEFGPLLSDKLGQFANDSSVMFSGESVEEIENKANDLGRVPSLVLGLFVAVKQGKTASVSFKSQYHDVEIA